MRRTLACCAAVIALSVGPTGAQAQSADASVAPAPATSAVPRAYSTTTTQLGVLMADPQARTVLERHIPALAQPVGGGSAGGNLEQASAMTLKELQIAVGAYAGDMFSDRVLAAIDQDLAALSSTN